MIVKKSSWHYKLATSFGWYPPVGLCEYVRHMVGAALLWLVFGAVVVAMFLVFVANPFTVILSYFGIIAALPHDRMMIGSAILGMEFAVGVLIAAKFLYSKYRDQFPVVKEQNIIVAYYKAKKEKICPTITYE